MKCPKCKENNKPGVEFCANCGAKMPKKKTAAKKTTATKASTKTTAAKPTTKTTKAKSTTKTKTAAATSSKAKASTKTTAANSTKATKAKTEQAVASTDKVENQKPSVIKAETPKADTAQTQQKTTSVKNKKTCLGLAFGDIVHSKAWFGKLLLLSLVEIVPILNIFTKGYCQQWGVECARGNDNPMPKGIFSNRNFITGLYEFLVWTIYSILLVLAVIVSTVVFAFLPIVSFILGVATFIFCFFYTGFIALSSTKAALKIELHYGFDIKANVKAFGKKPSALIAATLVPSLVAWAIGIILLAIAIVIIASTFGLAFMSNLGSLKNVSYEFGPQVFQYVGTLIQTIASFVGLFGTIIVVFVFVIALLSAFEKLWRYRTVGRWIQRYAPQWVSKEDKEPKYIRI